jgi:hypothetical protein
MYVGMYVDYTKKQELSDTQDGLIWPIVSSMVCISISICIHACMFVYMYNILLCLIHTHTHTHIVVCMHAVFDKHLTALIYMNVYMQVLHVHVHILT